MQIQIQIHDNEKEVDDGASNITARLTRELEMLNITNTNTDTNT